MKKTLLLLSILGLSGVLVPSRVTAQGEDNPTGVS